MTGQPWLTGSLAPLVLSAHPVSRELRKIVGHEGEQ